MEDIDQLEAFVNKLRENSKYPALKQLERGEMRKVSAKKLRVKTANRKLE